MPAPGCRRLDVAFASETLQWTDHRDLHQCRPAACGAPAGGTRVSTDRWHFDRSGDGATQRRTSRPWRDDATAIRRLGASTENAGGTSAVVPILRVEVPERWKAHAVRDSLRVSPAWTGPGARPVVKARDRRLDRYLGTSLLRASVLPSPSSRKASHSSWVSMRATISGSRTKCTPRARRDRCA